MSRPESPVGINDLESFINNEDIDETLLTIEDFKSMARAGFTILLDKLGETSIKTDDALLAFWNYNVDTSVENDKYIMTSFYCLASIMLVKKKTNLDEIDPSVYDKLMSYTINIYNEKNSQY
jgi:hypothetical protein